MRALSLCLLAALGACSKDVTAPIKPAQPTGGDPTNGQFALKDALEGLEGSGQLMARIETSTGTMVFELFEAEVPNTVANFVGLARGTRPFQDPTSGEWVKRPFYDGLTFHRVIPNFMIQGGDPLGRGTGGPGYKFVDEIVPSLKHDRPGRLSMANAGPIDLITRKPGTNGSQFFVTERPTPHLDGRHTIFGTIVEGMEVQKRIARMPADMQSGRPEQPIVISKITIFRNAK